MDSSPDAKIENLTILTAVFGSCLLLLIMGVITYLLYARYKQHATETSEPAQLQEQASPLQKLMDLTIVVTDIESSTSLWETVDADIMNRTLNLHHTLIRKLLKAWDGHEEATEGDSFILSFCCPQNALDFSLDLQTRLMGLSYADVLLEHPVCAPLWVRPSDDFVKRHGPEWKGQFGLLDASLISAEVENSSVTFNSAPDRTLSPFASTSQQYPSTTPLMSARHRASFELPAATRNSGSGVSHATLCSHTGPKSGSEMSHATLTSHPPMQLSMATSKNAEKRGKSSSSTTRVSSSQMTNTQHSLGKNLNSRGPSLGGPSTRQGSDMMKESSISAPMAEEPEASMMLPRVKSPVQDHLDRQQESSKRASISMSLKLSKLLPRISAGLTKKEAISELSEEFSELPITFDPLSSQEDNIMVTMNSSGLSPPPHAPPPPAPELHTIDVSTYLKSVFAPSQSPIGGQGSCAAKKVESALTLAFRGLRVRVGLYSPSIDEIKDAYLSWNDSSSRPHTAPQSESLPQVDPSGPSMPYRRKQVIETEVLNEWIKGKMGSSTMRSSLATGACLARAKAVGDAGAGGMICVSSSCFDRIQLSSEQCRLDRERKGSKLRQAAPCLFLCMGNHVLRKPTSSRSILIHQAISPSLTPRLALFSPMRTHEKLELDAMEAPLGKITIAFANLVGVSALMAWDKRQARKALDTFSSAATQLLKDSQGYIVEMTQDGLCLAAFADPLDAVVWAAGLIEVLKHTDWDPELLEHELCEEVVLSHINDSNPSLNYCRVQGSLMTGAPLSVAPSSTAPQLAEMMKELDLHIEASQHSLCPPSVSPAKSFGMPHGDQTLLPLPPSNASVSRLLPLSTLNAPAGSSSLNKQPSRSKSIPGNGLDPFRPSRQRPSPFPAGLHPPPPSLSHEASTTTVLPVPCQSQGLQRIILLRGPRLKIGIDEGLAAAELSPATGRMIYRGKFMNRAARISAKAPSGACWCSEAVWEGAKEQASAEFVASLGLVGDPLGLFTLKGVREEMKLVQCSFSRTSAAAFTKMADVQSQRMSRVEATFRRSSYESTPTPTPTPPPPPPPPSFFASMTGDKEFLSEMKLGNPMLKPVKTTGTRGRVVRAATRIGLMSEPPGGRGDGGSPGKYSTVQYNRSPLEAFARDDDDDQRHEAPPAITNPGVKYMQAMLKSSTDKDER